MNDLIRNLVFGGAIAAVVAGSLSLVASLPGEPEYIARCAATVVKMPCL